MRFLFPSFRHERTFLTPCAQYARRHPTASERILWEALRGRKLGVKFRRQVVLGFAIVDFFAPEPRLVVEVDGNRYLLDIRFRMLQPHELALAQGFPASYRFTGNKTEQVKQIGNAVPRRLARALVAAAISQNEDVSALVEAEEALSLKISAA